MSNTSLLTRLDRLATRRNTWLAGLLFSAVGTWLLLADAQLQHLAPGLPKLDFRLHGYSVAEVKQLFTAYGPAGLEYYWQQMVVDTVFPVLVGAFGVLFFASTSRRWGWTQLGNTLIVASLAFALIDLAENACIFALLRQPTHPATLTVAAGSLLTQVKIPLLLLIYFFMVVHLLIAAARVVMKAVKGRLATPQQS